jgi:hypothetical protein
MEINQEDTLEIGKTHNGFVLKSYFYDSDDEKGNKIIGSDLTVFEFKDDEQEKEKLKELFLEIAEQFGYIDDRYGKENLNISFDRKGSKYEEPESHGK